jgi:hypothetical protein
LALEQTVFNSLQQCKSHSLKRQIGLYFFTARVQAALPNPLPTTPLKNAQTPEIQIENRFRYV